jgi:hypothetical protein
MKPTLIESSVVRGGIAKDAVEASDKPSGVDGNEDGVSPSFSQDCCQDLVDPIDWMPRHLSE